MKKCLLIGLALFSSQSYAYSDDCTRVLEISIMALQTALNSNVISQVEFDSAKTKLSYIESKRSSKSDCELNRYVHN